MGQLPVAGAEVENVGAARRSAAAIASTGQEGRPSRIGRHALEGRGGGINQTERFYQEEDVSGS